MRRTTIPVDYVYSDFGTNGNEPGSGRDRLFGQGGNDLLFGEGGDGAIDGGGGDCVDYGSGETANPVDFIPPIPTPPPTLIVGQGITFAGQTLPQGNAARVFVADAAHPVQVILDSNDLGPGDLIYDYGSVAGFAVAADDAGVLVAGVPKSLQGGSVLAPRVTGAVPCRQQRIASNAVDVFDEFCARKGAIAPEQSAAVLVIADEVELAPKSMRSNPRQ